MQFVCGNSNLSPKPKFSSIGKLSRGVMHKDRAFTILKKILNGLIVMRQTTFRMTASILIDVID